MPTSAPTAKPKAVTADQSRGNGLVHGIQAAINLSMAKVRLVIRAKDETPDGPRRFYLNNTNARPVIAADRKYLCLLDNAISLVPKQPNT